MNRPSNLELQVLSILWKHGASTVREVLDELPDGRDRAYTTVLSVLQNMTSKKLARRESIGRAHAYAAALSRRDALAPLVAEWVHYFFSGDVDELVALARSAPKRPVKQRTATKTKNHTGSMAKKKTTTKKKAAPKKAAPKKAAPKKKAAVKKAAKKAAPKKKAAVKKVAKKKAAPKKKAAAKKKAAPKKKAVAKKKAAPKKKAAAKKKAAPKKKVAAKKAAPKKKAAAKKKAAPKK